MKRVVWVLSFMCFIKLSMACTAFGIITESGTILGKNRNALYTVKQTFGLLEPNKQFYNWYDNKYHHSYKFYAVMAQNDVKMGINEHGLTAIEEDPLYPEDAHNHRRYQQPINGFSEGFIMYGVLQNFATIDEMKPYINQIFSIAAPNLYQFADGFKILEVEVGYADEDNSQSRNIAYKIIDKPHNYFVQTNTYLMPKFSNLNDVTPDKNKLLGSNYRLTNIANHIQQDSYADRTQIINWLTDTKSNLGVVNDNNWCLNTSIFRTYLFGLNDANIGMANHKAYGTVSNMIVFNTNNANTTVINLQLLESIHPNKDGSQQIKYNEMQTTLANLFATKNIKYQQKTLERQAPTQGVCR